MNLALQKRHEQLERWRQHEADFELMIQKQKEQQQRNEIPKPTKLRAPHALHRSPSSPIDRRLLFREQTDLPLNGKKKLGFDKSTSDSNKSRRSKNPDLQVKFSDSILFLTACANGDSYECERLLNDRSIDINVTTSDGLTGLHEAAICGNHQLVEFLLQRGAEINCCDDEGWTPLHAAASLGQTKIVELLLDHDADVTIVNCENLLAYDLSRNEEVQKLIAERMTGLDLDQLHSQEERAIQQDIDRWLKTGCYDERSHPLTNATVLHVIAAKGYIELMKRILESPVLKKQIDLEAKDNEGFTPLLAASFWSQMEIVDLLIQYGANIFAQANNGYKISSIVSMNRSIFKSLLTRLILKIMMTRARAKVKKI